MERQTYDITTMHDLSVAATAVLDYVRNAPSEASSVVCLTGELGSGKTTFVQEVARQLGVADTVTSPTFVIVKSYTTTDRTFTELVHVDAYRVESIDEMETIGFDSYMNRAGAIMCIEWSERIQAILPEDALHLSFAYDGTHRTLTIT